MRYLETALRGIGVFFSNWKISTGLFALFSLPGPWFLLSQIIYFAIRIITHVFISSVKSSQYSYDLNVQVKSLTLHSVDKVSYDSKFTFRIEKKSKFIVSLSIWITSFTKTVLRLKKQNDLSIKGKKNFYRALFLPEMNSQSHCQLHLKTASQSIRFVRKKKNFCSLKYLKESGGAKCSFFAISSLAPAHNW